MRILEIIPCLVSGGGERFVVDLSNELCSKGNDVKLIVLNSLEGDMGFFCQEVSSNIEIISLNKGIGFSVTTFYRLYKYIKKLKPDVVHFHLRALLYGFITLLLYKKPKYYHTVHNDAKMEAETDLLSMIVRKISFRHKLVTPITISEESKLSFLNYYGFSTPMINNGRNIPDINISPEIENEFKKYRKSDNTKVIINLARFGEQKRQPLLARVVKRLESDGFDFSVLIVGSTFQTSIVEETMGVGCEKLYILGEKPNPLEYLKASDAFCLASSYEGMPISLIEALGVGAIPICTPVGGIVDAIKDGYNGFLASDLSEDALYHALKKYLEMKDSDIKLMKERVLSSYLPYSMSECASKYIELFKKK